MGDPVIAAAVTAIVAFFTSILTAYVTLRVADRRARIDEKLAHLKGELEQRAAERRERSDEKIARLKSEFEHELTKAKAATDKELAEQKAHLDHRALFAAERVASSLLMHKEWRTRTFRIIKARLGGFEDDELRQILVRAGAIRVTGPKGEERWGLLDRNMDFLEGKRKWDNPDSEIDEEMGA